MLSGLTSAVARERLAQFGPNVLRARDRRSLARMVWNLASEPMLLLLAAATGIYVAFGDVGEAIALGCSVLVIITITLYQERRTERALDALRELASPHAKVLRDGEWCELDARSLVPGDLCQVGEGMRVPADGLVRSGTPLSVDEAVLTGESVPVVRGPDPEAGAIGRLGDAGASVFAGTLVVSGTAVVEVVHTGMQTEVGRIGAALGQIEIARAPLQREVARIVRRVAVGAFALCAALVLIYLAVGHGWVGAVLAGITLAMALLPEELPLVLTVFMTFGAWRMSRHRVLARRGDAIETLGAVTVLCVDKTGTLTQNKMAIQRIVTSIAHDVDARADELPEAVHEAVELGALAAPLHSTDPMDLAFASLLTRTLSRTEHVHPRWEWVREYPLSPGLLAVTHVWRDDARRLVIATKGAPEAIIDLCHLSPDDARTWRSRADAMAESGLRVLGIARATYDGASLPENPHDYVFEIVGMVGLADPLRDDTVDMVAKCKRAGVRIVMITGDHPMTAQAIARGAGLDVGQVVTGAELERSSDPELSDVLGRVQVIARAAPAHKLRIIQGLRARGEVVGMTGDGVNDAPALKAADVGIAMGRGTDVAREAAGLVILDDALGAIVTAIEIGRTIYDNLKKVSTYLLAVHVPIAGLALVPPLLGWPVLLGPVHVVFLELMIDPTCSIIFELEPSAPDVMSRSPRGRGEHLFDRRRLTYGLVLGLLGITVPLAVAAGAQFMGAAETTMRMLSFTALVAVALGLVIATRLPARERNPGIRWMLPIVGALWLVTVTVPPIRALFGFV